MTSTPQIGLTRPDFIDLVAAEHDGGLPDREVREIAGQMWRLIQTGLNAFTTGDYNHAQATDDSDYPLHPLRMGEAIVELDDGTVWLHGPVSPAVYAEGIEVTGGTNQQLDALRDHVAHD